MTTSHHQTGFAAIAAIFLLVVLAALGAFMVTFSNTQQLTAAQDLQGTRAFWAARGGLEWGITSAAAAIPPACPAPSTTLTIDGFTVKVACTVTSPTIAEAGNTPKIIQFIAVASVGTVGSVGFIERSVSAALER